MAVHGHPNLVDRAAANIVETLTFYRLPRAYRKHLKSTNMLERLNEEIKRRTRVARIFPNGESWLRLMRALCVEIHEAWLEDKPHLNMMPPGGAEEGGAGTRRLTRLSATSASPSSAPIKCP